MLFDRSLFAVLAALIVVTAPVLLVYSTHVAARPIETEEGAEPSHARSGESALARLPEIVITAKRIAGVVEPRPAD